MSKAIANPTKWSRGGKTTERLTIDHLKTLGWSADRCGGMIGPTMHDCWGFADVAAVHENRVETLWIQCTTHDHVSHRVDKILHPMYDGILKKLLRSGSLVEVWGFRGKKLWKVRTFELDGKGEVIVIEGRKSVIEK